MVGIGAADTDRTLGAGSLKDICCKQPEATTVAVKSSSGTTTPSHARAPLVRRAG
jgi:hypothetical protein